MLLWYNYLQSKSLFVILAIYLIYFEKEIIMAMNPLKLLKLKDRYKIFKSDHPKLLAFASAAGKSVVSKGSTVKIQVTSPEGKTLGTEFEITADDMKTLEILKDLKS